MLKIGKIVGFPVKLYTGHAIYIPWEYLRFYGISEHCDRLLMKKSEHSLLYSPCPTDCGTENTVTIRNGLTRIPAGWARKNHLKKGDRLFLLGLEGSLLLYVK